MNHTDLFTGGSGYNVNFRINCRKRFFQNDHGKNGSAGADIAGFRTDAVGCRHTGAGITFGRTERAARLQVTFRIQQQSAGGSQCSCIFARRDAAG